MTGPGPLPGESLASAARALVGTRYRLHGRDPATGLDCIGLLAASLAAIDRPARLPTGYSLRMVEVPNVEDVARTAGLAACSPPFAPGDVVFVRIGPCQFHLAIAVHCDGFVHAHAGLRRIVTVPALGDWRVIGSWRLQPI